MNPRASTLRPTASAPSPSVLGTRPTETISRSHSSFCAAPSLSAYSTVTPDFFAVTLPIFTPSEIARPCLVNCFQASFETASSQAPRKAGSASRIVTSEPRRRHTLPSSRPITPAPITPSRLGTDGKASAPSLSQTTSLSTATPGRWRALEPVATITCVASIVSPPTAILYVPPPPASFPNPCSQVILFFLKRYSIPLVILVTMDSLRDCIFPRSSFTPDTEMPCSSRWCPAFSYSSEDESSAFEGMQPTLRQVPPRASSPLGFFHPSMQAVFSPS